MGGIENELREQDLVATTVYLCGQQRNGWLVLACSVRLPWCFQPANVGVMEGIGGLLTRNRHMAATHR